MLFQNPEDYGVLYYVCLVVMVAVSAYMFYRTMYQRLPQIVREVLKMEGKRRDDIPKKG